MRRNNKKRLIPLALALVLALVGVALAVPTITLTVQELGQGQKVISSTITDATITWTLDSTNPDYVTGGEISVTTDPGSGTVYIKLYDGSTLVTYTSVNLDGSGTYTFSFASSVDLGSFDTVYVVYQGPNP
ncbi:hypothetical protein [Thermococcus barossii]|uniref:Uncharacterized protein n=1 Tax=Thermococcus barossii TaxID=54077 RepID=A0A2Z2ML03_9EURY|nr:hypothetical protein [Thermococcus barossii]ASJ05425.1 hypothetical protein A3L01_08655 [Thermococcus barossii]